MAAVHTVPPPDDVIRLLHAHGARVASPVGTDGSWWVARPVDDADGPWLEVQVADVPPDAALAARAHALTGLDHPHLARVRAVEVLGPGRVALVCEHVPGPTLAAVRAARTPLVDGEVVTVAVPVAQALDALHGVGLAHGAVGADRVVVRPGGVPVLVDLRGVLRGDGTPTGDVHRLLATLLGLMPPLDAHLAAGLDDAVRLRDALEGLLRTDARAADVVDTAFACADAEPVIVPDADALAGAQVALAHGRTSAPRVVGEDPVPARRPRRDRRVRRSRRAVAGLVVVVLLGAGAWGVRALVDRGAAADAPPRPSSPSSPSARVADADPTPDDADERALRDRQDPAGAAAVLTRRRAEALATVDGATLADLAVAGSPSQAADADLLAALAGARSEGLVVEVEGTTVTGGTPEGDTTVEVTSVVGPHVRVTPAGDRTDVPAAPSRTVELVLRWADARWRVLDVREPSGATP